MTTIDPRANWLSVDSVAVQPKWECVSIGYGDPLQSQGRVNIYVTVVGADGLPAAGVTVTQGWPDGTADQTADNGSTNFPQSGDSSFDPNRGESGPYWIAIKDPTTPSDKAKGFGLPLKRHVTYFVVFRKTTGSPTTPPPPSGGDWVSRQWLAAALRAAADKLDAA